MRYVTVLLLVILSASCATSGKKVFSNDEGAIRGYDPVAYFTDGGPKEGMDTITHQYNGAIWRFATEEHRELFTADPEKYAPQYGGYCAYAMANGFFVSTDPNAWHIHEDKLYLNYSLGVRERWRKDIPSYITKADKNWAESIPSQISAEVR